MGRASLGHLHPFYAARADAQKYVAGGPARRKGQAGFNGALGRDDEVFGAKLDAGRERPTADAAVKRRPVRGKRARRALVGTRPGLRSDEAL